MQYLFDMNLAAAIRVEANSPDEAVRMLKDALDAADTNFGAWPNGDPILGETSLNDEPVLVEDQWHAE